MKWDSISFNYVNDSLIFSIYNFSLPTFQSFTGFYKGRNKNGGFNILINYSHNIISEEIMYNKKYYHLIW